MLSDFNLFFLLLPSSLLGNVYIADRMNYRIRKLTVSMDIISTIAGDGTTSYSGDGGPATSASLYYPYGVALDSSSNIYITDTNNCCIRKVAVVLTPAPR